MTFTTIKWFPYTLTKFWYCKMHLTNIYQAPTCARRCSRCWESKDETYRIPALNRNGLSQNYSMVGRAMGWGLAQGVREHLERYAAQNVGKWNVRGCLVRCTAQVKEKFLAERNLWKEHGALSDWKEFTMEEAGSGTVCKDQTTCSLCARLRASLESSEERLLDLAQG